MSATPPSEPPYPGLISPSPPLTPQELAALERRLERAVRGRRRYRYRVMHPDGKFRRRLPLPWRVRARLRLHRTVDRTCSFLCGQGLEGAALALWRAAGTRPGRR